MALTQLELVTPSRTLYSGEAQMVVCRTEGGEIAFLADHMPYLGVLEPSLVRIVEASGDEIRLAVHSGFVEVRNNRVVMLADVAEPAGEIDLERARRALAAAEQRVAAAPEGDPEAELARRRAEVRIETAGAAPAPHPG
jgi:F-type H+-transporting ATPase subunit epsilon